MHRPMQWYDRFKRLEKLINFYTAVSTSDPAYSHFQTVENIKTYSLYKSAILYLALSKAEQPSTETCISKWFSGLVTK